MSNEKLSVNPPYDHFTSKYYERWADEPEMIDRAERVNTLIRSYLHDHDAETTWELPPEIQQNLNDEVRQMLTIEGLDD